MSRNKETNKMINAVNKVTLLVKDYDKAIEFYTTKLGFSLSENIENGNGNRWVTIRAKEDKSFEIVLAEAKTAKEKQIVGNDYLLSLENDVQIL